MSIAKGYRRFHSNIVSSRQVVTEISNLVCGSNVEQPSATPLASSKRPIRKRVKSADRREMLESFVSKYRAMNLGKFPSPTSAQKEVGGSYYLIKKMLQEMEYNFKMTPSVEKDSHPTKDQIKADDALSPVESSSTQDQIKADDVLSPLESSPSQDQIKADDVLSPVESSPSQNQIKSDDALSPVESSPSQEQSNAHQNICVESGSNFGAGNNNITRDDIATESDEQKNPRNDFKDSESKGESDEQNPRNDVNITLKDSESKVEKQPDVIRRDSEGEKDNELREKASLWGNLKSLANGFMSMWKK